MTERQPWELSIGSLTAVCDAWALDPKAVHVKAKGLVFLSVAAPSSTIKGIRGLIHGAKSSPATIAPLFTTESEPPPSTLSHIVTSPLRKGRQFQRRLSTMERQHHYICVPAGDFNAVVEEKDADEESQADTFYVFAPGEEDGPAAFYRQFIRRSPTPTLPQWALPIWEAAEDRNQVTRLESAGISAWRCEVNYDHLETAIVRALKRGHLTLN